VCMRKDTFDVYKNKKTAIYINKNVYVPCTSYEPTSYINDKGFVWRRDADALQHALGLGFRVYVIV